MKRLDKFIKSIAIVLGFVAVFVSCTEDNDDPMAINIKDVNGYITAIDKTIASPGNQVTVSGTNLDKVYKIMLNDNVSNIEFEATATSLTFTIPTSAPLGDVVIINFFFSGKGLAQKYIEIMSPPIISGFSPVAALGGEECQVYGGELYKAKTVFVGESQMVFTLVDDKHITIAELPTIANGDKIKIMDETGSEIISSVGFVRGTEILITDFDNSPYFTDLSSNGNIDGDTKETGALPYASFYTFTITNNNTSWGGNIDFYFTGVSDEYNDNSKVWLYIDVKVSDEISGRIMCEGPSGVYGDDVTFTTGWTTHKLKLSELYTGYGNGDEVGACSIMANMKGVKIQPPASSSANNFGKTISVDNIKFIVVE